MGTNTTGTGSRRRTGLGRAIALLAVLAVAALAAAATASAEDGSDPNGDPPLPAAAPNLLFSSASVAPYGTSEWEIRYTVANRGTAPTGSFRVTVRNNGSTLIKDTGHAALAAGASRSETIHVARTGCYLPVSFTADSTHVVAESRETDNVKWAIGMTSATCSTLPRYAVKAVSFHANDESGIDWTGSDEPYWIFSSVGASGTSRTGSSHVFQDIDSGDTAFFGATEGCLYLSCSGGAAPYGMGFSVQLWEQDFGDLSKIIGDTKIGFETAGSIASIVGAPSWVPTALSVMEKCTTTILGWAQDDLMGSQTFAFDPVYLASRLPSVGASLTDTRSYLDSGTLGSDYTMTVAVTRVG